MASSIIEESRQTAADIDLFDQTLSSLLLTLSNPSHSTHRSKLSTSHRAADILSRIVDRSQSLQASFIAEDRTREIDALAGRGGGPGSDLGEFYQRLAKIKDYHRKYPTGTTTGGANQVDFAALEGGDDEWLDKKFTGEEGLGRYLDLHELHEAWNNFAPASSSGTSAAGGWKRLTYLQYLATVTSFTLSQNLKSNPEYSKYLTTLLSYLSGFYERTTPLGDLDVILKEADEAFAKAWDTGLVKDWALEGEENAASNGGAEGIWCAACKPFPVYFYLQSSANSTYLPRAGQKRYSKETVYTAHLTSKKHLKQAEKLSSTTPSSSTSTSGPPPTTVSLSHLRQQKNRALALKEALITSLIGTPTSPLSSILLDTLSNTERRAALTDRERQAEIEEMEAREAAEAAAAAVNKSRGGKEGDEEEDDDDGRIYNPLRLPLGWDGKPIPFWLYKLHGLGVEYKCEICSDFVYMGRWVPCFFLFSLVLNN